ncbi:hypothetical protein EVAR_9042_1 [Eumeta japonica]|uniref:Uncharacterized protein n=1 Tax=Eumeta variegata TaxID=151549 RepID=A0A4C1TW22_EUMVA|nr:hypothetical protein EVAR_9042_1 [Eumeta japonica]
MVGAPPRPRRRTVARESRVKVFCTTSATWYYSHQTLSTGLQTKLLFRPPLKVSEYCNFHGNIFPSTGHNEAFKWYSQLKDNKVRSPRTSILESCADPRPALLLNGAVRTFANGSLEIYYL